MTAAAELPRSIQAFVMAVTVDGPGTLDRLIVR